VAGVGKRRGAYRDLVGKAEGKRPFGRPRHRWDDNTSLQIKTFIPAVKTEIGEFY
jgi:hypothetical protein